VNMSDRSVENSQKSRGVATVYTGLTGGWLCCVGSQSMAVVGDHTQLATCRRRRNEVLLLWRVAILGFPVYRTAKEKPCVWTTASVSRRKSCRVFPTV
jgi:hypothetical protein